MPRKNPLQKRENEICRRVKQARLERRLSQVTFAKEAGMDSTALASIEHQRAPLRYETAQRILKAFGLDPFWLATGESKAICEFTIPPSDYFGVDPRALFSKVFDSHLKQFCELEMEEIIYTPHFLSDIYSVELNDRGRIEAASLIKIHSAAWFQKVPLDKLNGLLNGVLKEGQRLLFEHSPELSAKWHHAMKLNESPPKNKT